MAGPRGVGPRQWKWGGGESEGQEEAESALEMYANPTEDGHGKSGAGRVGKNK